MSGTFLEYAESCWLVLRYPKNPAIRLDVRVLDRILADDDRIVLDANDFGTALQVRGGPTTASSIATSLAPYTRSAPMTCPELYEDAKRRLQNAMNLTEGRRSTALVVGENVVTVSSSKLWIGEIFYWHQQIAEWAVSGDAIKVPGGALHACLAMLVIADLYRRPEDVAILRAKISDYESVHKSHESIL
jgi:hypothetical protein